LVLSEENSKKIKKQVKKIRTAVDKIKTLFSPQTGKLDLFMSKFDNCNICDKIVDKTTIFNANCMCKYTTCLLCAVKIIITKSKYECPSCGGGQFTGNLL
jgi:hypothetical protein